MSESKLAAALVKAQAAIRNPQKSQDNPFFKSKYVDLAGVWDAIREPLTSNGIAVVQLPKVDGDKVGIETCLIHESGEKICAFFPLSVGINAKAQEMGSAMTYLRRYAISAMVGVAPEDEDDDGNAAQSSKTRNEPLFKLTDNQAAVLQEYEEAGLIKLDNYLKASKAKTVYDLTKEQYDYAVKICKEREAKDAAGQ